ncbi:MAG: hypothetical protein AB7I33_08955 [Gemmatimonadales bacterium]
MWPEQERVIHSPLPPAVLRARLRESVEPRRFLRLGIGARPFEGTVQDNEFRVWRIIGYFNSLIPTIDGIISSEGEGSRLRLQFRFPVGAAIILFILVPAVLWAFARGRATGPAYALLIMVGVVLVIALAAFQYEVWRATGLFRAIAEGDRRSPA